MPENPLADKGLVGRISDETPSGLRMRTGAAKLRIGAVAATLVALAAGASVVAAATGDATAGKAVFTSAGCTGCHTLAAAGSTGTVGPNLDQRKPTYDMVVARVTSGKGIMPSFSGSLSAQQIANVAAFVSQSTGGSPAAAAPPPATAPPGTLPPPASPGQPENTAPKTQTPANGPGGDRTVRTPPAGGAPGKATPRAGTRVRVTFAGRRLVSTATRVPEGVVTVSVRNRERMPLQVIAGRTTRRSSSGLAGTAGDRRLLLVRGGASRHIRLVLGGGDRGYVCRVLRQRPVSCLTFQALSTTPKPARTPGPGAPEEPAPPWPPSPPVPVSPVPPDVPVVPDPRAPASPSPTPPAGPSPPAPTGKSLFIGTCGGCHTLADAGTPGTVGPNLDNESPNEGKVRDQVLSGGGVMPSFRGVLTTEQIQMIAVYVASVT